jgi:hypothetical protein
MENRHLEDSPSSDSWNSVLHKKGAWGDWILHLVWEGHEQYRLSWYAWVVCSPTDGTPSSILFFSARYWGPTVRESLNKTFPNELGWMDQSLGSLFPWYSLIGFFLLRLCEGPGISSKVGSVVELHVQINNAAVSMTLQMLENTWHEIEYCLDILRATNGAHIEVYWTWWVVLWCKANYFSVSRKFCVLCVFEVWWINCGHSLCVFVCMCAHMQGSVCVGGRL